MKKTTKLLALIMACSIIAASLAACSEKRILVIDDDTGGSLSQKGGSLSSGEGSVDPSDDTTAYIAQTPGGASSSSGKVNGTYANETMPDDIYVSSNDTSGVIVPEEWATTDGGYVIVEPETTHYVEEGYVVVEFQATSVDGLSLLYEKKDGSKKFTHFVVTYFHPNHPDFPAPSATDVIIPANFDNLPVEGIGTCAFLNSGIVTIVIPASINIIEDEAFKNCEALTSVYYQGTEAEWALINIERKNDSLLAATRYYYSETEPTAEGNFWRYVDGVPTPW